jgi:hypothetical protein
MCCRVCLIVGWILFQGAIGSVFADSREWTDREGRFLIRGELVAASEDAIVIRKGNRDLIAVPLKAISDEDRGAVSDYRQAQRSDPATAETIGEFHSWTTRGGAEFKARIKAFAERPVKFEARSGMILVNGTSLGNLDSFRLQMAAKVVAEFDDPSVNTEADLRKWIRGHRGNPPSFLVQGVMVELPDGTELPVPFFLFEAKDLEILRPGWERWRDSQENEAAQRQESFLLAVQADQYRSQQQEAQQIRMMQLELLGAATGLTTIWEVYLSPRPGVFGRPVSVVVSARDSQQAQQMAAARYPGFVVGSTRALSR